VQGVVLYEVVRDPILRVRVLVSRDVLQRELAAVVQDALHVLRARPRNPTDREVLVLRRQGLRESVPLLVPSVRVPLEAVVKDEVAGRRLALPGLAEQHNALRGAPSESVPLLGFGEGEAESLHRQGLCGLIVVFIVAWGRSAVVHVDVRTNDQLERCTL
jgi:hypothetical protein